MTPTASPPLPRSASVPDRAPPASVAVLVVDDHSAVRAGVQRLLDAEPDLTVRAVSGGARAAIAAATAEPIDVAVVDYQLGVEDGLVLTRDLKALPWPPRVLIYSAYADAPLAVAAMVAGADGMLTKGGLGDELCQAVRRLARGGAVLPRVPQPVIDMLAARLVGSRDRAIFGMLVHGLGTDEIAAALAIDAEEVERRRRAILRVVSAPPGAAAPGYERSGPLDYDRARRLRRRPLRRRPAG